MANFIKIALAIICIGIRCELTIAEKESLIIRDAETEELLTEIAQKIFDVAGLRKKSAKLYVIQSNAINAFTIGNGYIFVTSGLLFKLKNPIHLIAVLSHETGHIAAGHIDSMMNKLQNGTSNLLMAMLAGIIGGLATGSADVSNAIMMGYLLTGERMFLRFSREQESAADMLGASYLEKMGCNPQAMVEVFEIFERMDILGGAANIPTYIRTHPKSMDRIYALTKRKKINGESGKRDAKLFAKYKRVTEKLKYYISGNKLPIPEEDYPKAICLHKRGRSREAAEILTKLVNTNPKDVYYIETLAQILGESGRPLEAVKYYKQIYGKNSHVLIKVDYANALIQTNQPDIAIKILESAKYEDYFNPEIFRLLANAYGQKGKQGISFFMLAQEQILLQNYQRAYDLLKNSVKLMNQKTENSYVKKAKYLKQLLEREKKVFSKNFF